MAPVLGAGLGPADPSGVPMRSPFARHGHLQRTSRLHGHRARRSVVLHGAVLRGSIRGKAAWGADHGGESLPWARASPASSRSIWTSKSCRTGCCYRCCWRVLWPQGPRDTQVVRRGTAALLATRFGAIVTWGKMVSLCPPTLSHAGARRRGVLDGTRSVEPKGDFLLQQ